MRWSRTQSTAVMLAVLAVLAVGARVAVGLRARAHAAQGCSGVSARHSSSNPLALARPPGANPLHGANFFVDGPRHGLAAGAIARLLGIDPTRYPDSYTWAQFQSDLGHGALRARLASNSGLAHRVFELEKIADQPEAQRFAAGDAGGTISGLSSQVNKIFCGNLTADPGAIPIIVTYFLHPDAHGCPNSRGLLASIGPRFRAQVDAVAAGTGNHPAVYLLELDGIGSSECVRAHGLLGLWESDLRYEAHKLGSLPHTVVYLEAGYSDANGPAYTARVLNAAGVHHIRGFFTNDTHLNWTSHELRWAQQISHRTGGADFIINTAQNGNGPQLNPHPATQGLEALCNPTGRAIGPQPTTATGFTHADAFLWTHVPAISSGSCNGGTPAGSFWVARAIQMAERANGKLGPGYPGRPY